VGSNTLKSYLVNHARSFIYTTALPEQSLMTIRRAYEWQEQQSQVKQQLQELIGFFRQHKIAVDGAYWLDSQTPIQSLILGNNEVTKALALYLQQQGIKLAAVLPPTVPDGAARIRICLHAFNTEEEVRFLFNTISQWRPKEL
jgi:8-amino-7-oxononanoate synthase